MNVLDDRPDPDALLLRVQQDEQALERGKLKIFFGFAPGVGKTYRMLQVARDLIAERQYAPDEIVLGIIETHGRYDTECLVLGLELLPRKKVEYHGRIFEELDLDAALARKPKVLLVDELAHTNIPGSRHPKRWQDVEELLDAGIDVLTTLNVQHLESLNDVVAQITRIRVGETAPDSVLDRADSIELVDIAPEELLQRLKEGKVYLPAEAERAREHFFRRGNLLALRELALRRTAQHVDEDVRAYREEHGVAATWPAGERILVCVSPAPSSSRLIRAAARMAAGLRCSFVACYVESVTLEPLSEADRDRLDEYLRIAESLGGSTVRLTGQHVSETLVAYARQHNVTRIVIGKPTHSRWRDWLRGSLINEVVRGSGEIDIHVIGGDSAEERGAHDRPRARRYAPLWNYVSSAAVALAALGAALFLRGGMNLPDLEMLFLLAVMIAAVWFGRGPALVCAGLGVACYDFFLVPPYHTFLVHDRKYFLTFTMMFGVGYVMSELTGRLRRHEHDALAREKNTGVLYALTRELASTDLPDQIAAIAARRAADAFCATCVILARSIDGGFRRLGAFPADAATDEKAAALAHWALERDQVSGLGTDTLPGASILCAPLRAGDSRLGVLTLLPDDARALRVEQRTFLDVFCRQVAVALERARLSDDARLAALRAKAEEMRSSLLSAVSHDLRTPLASITGAATTLRDGAHLSHETAAELVEAIVDQAERLERLVANLLDMTRLDSGAVTLKRDWVPLEEVIGSALTRLESRLENRRISVDIADDVPLVFVDPVLFEQLFVNLLENAEKYTPKTTSVEIRAFKNADAVFIDVADEGPGLPVGTESKVFEKFFRGPHAGATGAGLGLAICKGIADAHGGHITANNREGQGAIFRVEIPCATNPPSVSPPSVSPPSEVTA